VTAEPKVSPRPWRVDPAYRADIQTHDGKEIGTTYNQEAVGMVLRLAGIMDAKNYEDGRANAAHIVRCVNAHDGLVDALEALSFTFAVEVTAAGRFNDLNMKLIEQSRVALAAAKEGA